MSKITDAWEQLGIIQRQRFEQATGTTPLRLTDAEREAVAYFAAFHGSPREGDAQAAATLRGLLGRLGHQDRQ